MQRFLKYGSFLLLIFLIACGEPYGKLQLSPAKQELSVLSYKPLINREVYRCLVNGKFLFKSFHLSGLLLFKGMGSGSTRAVFQNEMGFTLFDFEWDKNDSFQVHSIIPQLNKPALIKTLRKDLEVVLMKNLHAELEKCAAGKDVTIYRFPLEKGFVDYVVSEEGIRRIYIAGKKKVATINVSGYESGMPDSIFVQHHTANFTIELFKIKDHAE